MPEEVVQHDAEDTDAFLAHAGPVKQMGPCTQGMRLVCVVVFMLVITSLLSVHILVHTHSHTRESITTVSAPMDLAQKIVRLREVRSQNVVVVSTTTSAMVKITQKRMTIGQNVAAAANGGSGKLFFQTAGPQTADTSKGTVLLLHGAKFSSQTWVDLGTMAQLARSGYQVVAIDLPGFGRSREMRAPTGVPARAKWLSQTIHDLVRDLVKYT